MQEMVIYGVSFDMVGKQPIVLLKTVDSNKFLPIWIGHPEAAAILMKLQGATTPRPMTHDLLCDMLGELDVSCTQVAVTELRDNTFFASITLTRQRPRARDRLAPERRARARRPLRRRRSSPPRRSSPSRRSSSSTRSRTPRRSSTASRSFLDQVTPEDFAGDSFSVAAAPLAGARLRIRAMRSPGDPRVGGLW